MVVMELFYSVANDTNIFIDNVLPIHDFPFVKLVFCLTFLSALSSILGRSDMDLRCCQTSSLGPQRWYWVFPKMLSAPLPFTPLID